MRWDRNKIKNQLQEIKRTEGVVHYSYVRTHYDKLRGAIDRLFGSYGEALEFSGFNPDKEKGDSGSGFRGKQHTKQTKQKIGTKMRGKYTGNKNPMYGKSHSDATKHLISLKSKAWHLEHPDYQTGSKNAMHGKTHSTDSNQQRSVSLKKYNSQFDKRPYNLTPDGRKKIQQGRAKAIANQKSCGTDIELIVEKWLKDFGINHIFQWSFKFFTVDFFLPDHNVVIWCDGDYWHSNPLKYKQLSARQRTQNRLDKSQESYLNNRSIGFCRLWGSDIKSHPEQCQEVILNLIKGD